MKSFKTELFIILHCILDIVTQFQTQKEQLKTMFWMDERKMASKSKRCKQYWELSCYMTRIFKKSWKINCIMNFKIYQYSNNFPNSTQLYFLLFPLPWLSHPMIAFIAQVPPAELSWLRVLIEGPFFFFLNFLRKVTAEWLVDKEIRSLNWWLAYAHIHRDLIGWQGTGTEFRRTELGLWPCHLPAWGFAAIVRW